MRADWRDRDNRLPGISVCTLQAQAQPSVPGCCTHRASFILQVHTARLQGLISRLAACGLRLATAHGISRAEASVPLSKQAPAGGVGGVFAGRSESDGRGLAGQAGRRPPPPPERPRSAGNSLRPREECRCRPAGPGAAPSPAAHTARTAVGSAPDSPADRQFHGFHLARSIASRMPTCNAGSRPELACVLHLARPPTPRKFAGRCTSGDHIGSVASPSSITQTYALHSAISACRQDAFSTTDSVKQSTAESRRVSV